MVAQVVALALFEVLKYYRLGGAIIPLIPITAFVKVRSPIFSLPAGNRSVDAGADVLDLEIANRDQVVR